MTVYPARLQFATGTAEEWTAANPVLLEGEFGHEKDTQKFKIGDGVSYWTNLPYAEGAGLDAVRRAFEWAVKLDGKVDGVDYSSKFYAGEAKKIFDAIDAKFASWASELARAEALFGVWGKFYKVIGTAPNQEVVMYTGNPALDDAQRPRYRWAADGRMYYKPVGGNEIQVITDNGIQRKTAAQWVTANPVLPTNFIGLESDTNKFKIGDGNTPWNTLPYVTSPVAANEIDGGDAASNYQLP